jgi:hypothetical protein
MAGGWELFRSGPAAPLPREIEDAPLELYRTHAHQESPEIRARGMELFQPGYQEYWLPQRMGQQQWKKDEDGGWRMWNSSAQTYLAAAMQAPMASPRGGSTSRLPTLRAPRVVDAFQQTAIDLMQQGIFYRAGKPEDEPGYNLSRNISPPQILPEDMEALSAYEDSAVGAAERSKGAAVRRCISEMRTQDAELWGLTRRGR